MLGFKSKNIAPEKVPVYLVVHRSPMGGFEQKATLKQAIDAFEQTVALGHHTPAGRRKLLVTGPDYCILPESDTDPLLIGPAALKAVLTDQEYAAIVLGPVAEGVLAS